MTAAGLAFAELALKATAILTLALVLASAAKRVSAEERHLIWAAALLGLLLLPFLAALGPAVEVRIDRLSAGADEPAFAPGTQAAPAAALAPSVPGPEGGARTGGEAMSAPDWPVLVGTGHAAVMLALLSWFALSSRRVTSSLGRLEDCTDASTLALLGSATRRAGLRRCIRLKLSATDVSPFAWGCLRPVIVLPRSFFELSDAERRNVIEHELAHVTRWDFLTASLAWVCCAVYWFHPLAWLARRRLIQESEIACDDRVVLGGNCPGTYAHQLLEIARAIHGMPRRHAAAASMAGASPVSRRIAAILDPRRRRRTMNRSKLAGVLAVAAAFLVPIGALTAEQAADVSGAVASKATDLEQRVRRHAQSGQGAEAARLLALHLVQGGEGASCAFCAAALATERAPAGPDELLPVVLDAFDRVEQRARAGADGDLLVRLAEICRTSGGESALERGTYYLLEGFRIGGLSDASSLAGVEFLSDLGWYAEAKSLAQKLHDDPHSGLYRSPEAGHLIRQLEHRIARTKFIADRLIAPRADVEIEDDVPPLYRRAPVYPPAALAAHLEGEVELEFTLSETGRPEDIRVVSSTDASFEQPSISAVSDWLYAPHLVAGVPVAKPGVKLMMRFQFVE